MKLSLRIFLLSLVASVSQGRVQNGHLRGLSLSSTDGSESTDGMVFRLSMMTASNSPSTGSRASESTPSTDGDSTSTSTDGDSTSTSTDGDSTSTSTDGDSTSTSTGDDSSSSPDTTTSDSTPTSSDDSPSTTGRDSSSDSSSTSSDTSRDTSTTTTTTSTDSSSSSERAESSERDERSSRLECRKVSDYDEKCVVWVTNVHQGTISRAYVATQGPLYTFEVTDYEVNDDSSLESGEADEYEDLSSGDASWDADVAVDSSGDVNTESDLPDVTCFDLMNNPEYQFQDSELDSLGAAWNFTNDEEYPCTDFGKNLIWFFIKERFLPT